MPRVGCDAVLYDAFISNASEDKADFCSPAPLGGYVEPAPTGASCAIKIRNPLWPRNFKHYRGIAISLAWESVGRQFEPGPPHSKTHGQAEAEL